MMHDKRSLKTQSRRQVQRRFVPGTLAIHHVSCKLGMVVGWSPVAAELNPYTGFERRAASWEVLLLFDDRIERRSWESIREDYNLDEWEQ